MKPAFQTWAARTLTTASLNSYMSGLRSVEAAYGDLDALYDQDRFETVFRELSFPVQTSGRVESIRPAFRF